MAHHNTSNSARRLNESAESVYRGKPDVAMPLFDKFASVRPGSSPQAQTGGGQAPSLPQESTFRPPLCSVATDDKGKADGSRQAQLTTGTFGITQSPWNVPNRPACSPSSKAHARKTDPATSHAAAASVRLITPLKRKIIWLFRNYGPMTDERLVETYEEIRHHFGDWSKATPQSIRSRRAELTRAPHFKVEDSGATAKISTGRQATVWKLK